MYAMEYENQCFYPASAKLAFLCVPYMNGMNNLTGKPLDGIEHLRQSIIDILTTPIGSRVMRPSYGSNLYELVDSPINSQTLVEIYAATIQALIQWEPRLLVTKVSVEKVDVGKITVFVQGEYRPTGEQITLEGIII